MSQNTIVSSGPQGQSLLNPPESVAEQKARIQLEAERARATANLEKMLERAAAPMKGRPVDTTGDLFNQDYAAAPLFATTNNKPKVMNKTPKSFSEILQGTIDKHNKRQADNTELMRKMVLEQTTAKPEAPNTKPVRKIYTDPELRALKVCIGCGSPKGPELAVCWNCFKYEKTRFTPLKYWDGSDSSWQQHLIECGVPNYAG